MTCCKKVRLAKEVLHCTVSSETAPSEGRDGMVAAVCLDHKETSHTMVSTPGGAIK
jgi:hypothetical protein